MNNEEKKKRKHGRLVEQIADGMKRIADGTKQNKKRQKGYFERVKLSHSFN
ncbi:hypothetical protein T12_3870 [Trichinella patagoniensis]|uniref:Uncharacterized protein n=2 Tax=Trichinella patagoniensis TaxID=990121 RepID=A0A0V0W6C4_9BILA|nr:hypothetical protein T12_3870 [Trichinella patagoniensis]